MGRTLPLRWIIWPSGGIGRRSGLKISPATIRKFYCFSNCGIHNDLWLGTLGQCWSRVVAFGGWSCACLRETAPQADRGRQAQNRSFYRGYCVCSCAKQHPPTFSHKTRLLRWKAGRRVKLRGTQIPSCPSRPAPCPTAALTPRTGPCPATNPQEPVILRRASAYRQRTSCVWPQHCRQLV